MRFSERVPCGNGAPQGRHHGARDGLVQAERCGRIRRLVEQEGHMRRKCLEAGGVLGGGAQLRDGLDDRRKRRHMAALSREAAHRLLALAANPTRALAQRGTLRREAL